MRSSHRGISLMSISEMQMQCDPGYYLLLALTGLQVRCSLKLSRRHLNTSYYLGWGIMRLSVFSFARLKLRYWNCA
eukprot:1063241-Amphidinium_carterae.1